MKNCPYCAEEIQDEAIKCKHCGSDLSQPPKATVQPPVQTTPTISPLIKPKQTLYGCSTSIIVIGAVLGIIIIANRIPDCGKNKTPQAKSAKELITQADQFMARSDYDAAIQRYNEIIKKYPQSSEAKIAAQKLPLAQDGNNKQILANADTKADELKTIWNNILQLEKQKAYDKALNNFKNMQSIINEIQTAIDLGYQPDEQTTNIINSANDKKKILENKYSTQLESERQVALSKMKTRYDDIRSCFIT